MAYFDNAATTYPKPESVYAFMDEFYRNCGANVGRGAYKLAQTASKLVAETRELIKELEVETVFSFKIAGYKIDVAESVVVTWIIMAVLILAAIILTRNLKVHNISKRQALIKL